MMLRRAFRKLSFNTLAAALLLLTLGGAFLFSAWSKFQDIDPFAWTLLDAGIPGDKTAAVSARLLVGLEAAIGLLLLVRVAVRKIALPLATVLLLGFSGYLAYLLAQQGNTGDCGCFGSLLPMKPLPALVKNAFLLLGIGVLARMHGWREWTPRMLPGAVLLLAFTALPLLLLPVSNKKETLELALLQDRRTDLSKGKQVVAFLSLGCPHCRHAARDFREFFKADATLPLTMILNGTPEEAEDFFRETGARNVPTRYETNPDVFLRLAGRYVPSIYYVRNGIIERRVSYNTLTPQAIRRWADSQP